MPRTRERRQIITFRLSVDALSRVDQLAAAPGRSRSDVLRDAIAAGVPVLEQRAKEPKP